jgi:hypothetical protein
LPAYPEPALIAKGGNPEVCDNLKCILIVPFVGLSKINFYTKAAAASCVAVKEGDATVPPWKTMPGLKKMHLIIHLNIIHYPFSIIFADILKL